MYYKNLNFFYYRSYFSFFFFLLTLLPYQYNLTEKSSILFSVLSNKMSPLIYTIFKNMFTQMFFVMYSKCFIIQHFTYIRCCIYLSIIPLRCLIINHHMLLLGSMKIHHAILNSLIDCVL